MSSQLDIDVSRLSPEQRHVLEELTGRELSGQCRLTIVMSGPEARTAADRPAQSAAGWVGVYEGMSAEQRARADSIILQRADLTRDFS